MIPDGLENLFSIQMHYIRQVWELHLLMRNLIQTDVRYPQGIILYYRDELDMLSEHISLILKKVRSYAELVSRNSFIDGMTGLGNRKAYIKKVHEINDKISGSYNFTAFIFNIQGLGNLNETYGYEAGDIAIRKAARALTKTFPFEYESVYHLNGGEYAVIAERELDTDVKGIYILVDEHLKSINEKYKKTEKEEL